MKKSIINQAQSYLTMATKDNGKRRILDIEKLFQNHPTEEVTDFLKTYIKEKQIALRDFILTDKTNPEVDETVALMFRVTMAIKTIEDAKEVRDVGRAK